MKELKYIEKIRREDSLLSLPQSLSQILAMVGNDDFSVNDLARVILKDPGLTSKILKMANSAFYQQRSRIASVNQAVMMLGIIQVKCLALSASVFRADIMAAKYKIDIKDLFNHFISVALGGRMVAEAIGMESTEEAFIAGLLHDIGVVYLIHHFPADYQEVISQVDKYSGLIEAERDILGTDHAALGYLLAEKWNFPPALAEAIAHHHDVLETVTEVRLVHIVQLSEMINKPIMDDRTRHIEQRLYALEFLSRALRIGRKKLDEISFSLLTETIRTAEYMGIDIGDPVEVLARANKELYTSFMTIENLFRERQELTRRILSEERRAAMLETKNVAMATLSHYVNNAAMAISGRAQLIRMLKGKGDIVDPENRLDVVLQVVDKSIKKIMAVLSEMRELTNLEELEKYSESLAVNIDERIRQRMEKMSDDVGLELTKAPLSPK
ncbi:MAG: HDOD domain-containing protein [candidate division Zixibacteria bacterium]|nr:HDOD domain-containing protein [candidate division Zixibacteria bacterium]